MKQLLVMLGIVLFLSGCSGCSQSGRRKNHHRNAADSVVTPPPTNVEGGRTAVKMETVNGVCQVPVEVNDDTIPFSMFADNRDYP